MPVTGYPAACSAVSPLSSAPRARAAACAADASGGGPTSLQALLPLHALVLQPSRLAVATWRRLFSSWEAARFSCWTSRGPTLAQAWRQLGEGEGWEWG